MDEAKWYFTHESEEDRLWYRIFFDMCKKFGVSWSKASSVQRAFIEEITRVNYERELAKREVPALPLRGFFDEGASARPKRCPILGKTAVEQRGRDLRDLAISGPKMSGNRCAPADGETDRSS